MTAAITLWISEDIEFVSVKDFDPPTPSELKREAQTAQMMSQWADEYNDRMEPQREAWLNQDSEGWGQIA